jgi:hypothetical protein
MLTVLQAIDPMHTGEASWQSDEASYHNVNTGNITGDGGYYDNWHNEAFGDASGFGTWLQDNGIFQESVNGYQLAIGNTNEAGGGTESWIDTVNGVAATGNVNWVIQGNDYSFRYGEVSIDENQAAYRYDSSSNTFLNYGYQNDQQQGHSPAGYNRQWNNDGYTFGDFLQSNDYASESDTNGLIRYTINIYYSGMYYAILNLYDEFNGWNDTTNYYGLTQTEISSSSTFETSYSVSGFLYGAGFGAFWPNQYTQLSTSQFLGYVATTSSDTTFSVLTGTTGESTYVVGTETSTRTVNELVVTSSNTTTTVYETTTSSDTYYNLTFTVYPPQTWMAPQLVPDVFIDPVNSYDFQTVYCPDDGEVLFTLNIPVTDLEGGPYVHSDLYVTVDDDVTVYPVNDISVEIAVLYDQSTPYSDYPTFQSYAMSVNTDNYEISLSSGIIEGLGNTYTTSDWPYSGGSPLSVGYTVYWPSFLPMQTYSSSRGYQTTNMQEYIIFTQYLTQDNFIAFNTKPATFVSSSYDEVTGFAAFIDDQGNFQTTVFSKSVNNPAGTLADTSWADQLGTGSGSYFTQYTASMEGAFQEGGSTNSGGRTRSFHTGPSNPVYRSFHDNLFVGMSPQFLGSGYQIAPYIDQTDQVNEGVGANYTMVYPYFLNVAIDYASVPYQLFYTGTSFFFNDTFTYPVTTGIGVSAYTGTTTIAAYDSDGNSFMSWDTDQPLTAYSISWDWDSSTADPYLNLYVTSSIVDDTFVTYNLAGGSGISSNTSSFLNRLSPLGNALQTVSAPYSPGLFYGASSLNLPYGINMNIDYAGIIIGGKPRYGADRTFLLQGDWRITDTSGATWVQNFDDVQSMDIPTDQISALLGADVFYFANVIDPAHLIFDSFRSPPSPYPKYIY